MIEKHACSVAGSCLRKSLKGLSSSGNGSKRIETEAFVRNNKNQNAIRLQQFFAVSDEAHDIGNVRREDEIIPTWLPDQFQCCVSLGHLEALPKLHSGSNGIPRRELEI